MPKPKAPTGKTKKYYERLKKRRENTQQNQDPEQLSFKVPKNLTVSPDDSIGSLTLSKLSEKPPTTISHNNQEEESKGQLIISGDETTINTSLPSHKKTSPSQEKQNSKLLATGVISLDGSNSLEKLLSKVREESDHTHQKSYQEDLMQTIPLGQTQLVTRTNSNDDISDMSSYVSIQSGGSFAEKEQQKRGLFTLFR